MKKLKRKTTRRDSWSMSTKGKKEKKKRKKKEEKCWSKRKNVSEGNQEKQTEWVGEGKR